MATFSNAVKFSDLTTKKDRVAFTREKLGTSQAWALRGLVRIFENQTADEQAAGTVSHDNGIGFTGIDGEFLSSLAKQYIARGSLSDKQMVHVYKKMPKYARQLVEAANAVSTTATAEVKALAATLALTERSL